MCQKKNYGANLEKDVCKKLADWPSKLLRGHKKKFKFEDENAGCAPNFQLDALNAIHRKKRFASFPSPAGMSLPNSPWAGIMTS